MIPNSETQQKQTPSRHSPQATASAGQPVLQDAPGFDSIYDELEYIASQIYSLLRNGYRYPEIDRSANPEQVSAANTSGLFSRIFPINCHSAPMNAILGGLAGIHMNETAKYLVMSAALDELGGELRAYGKKSVSPNRLTARIRLSSGSLYPRSIIA